MPRPSIGLLIDHAATSTETRLGWKLTLCNRAVSARKSPPSAMLTSNTSRRIPAATAGWGAAGLPTVTNKVEPLDTFNHL